MTKILRIPYIGINYIRKSNRICNALMEKFHFDSIFCAPNLVWHSDKHRVMYLRRMNKLTCMTSSQHALFFLFQNKEDAYFSHLMKKITVSMLTNPVRTKFFNNSQPIPPAPTTRIFDKATFSRTSSFNTPGKEAAMFSIFNSLFVSCSRLYAVAFYLESYDLPNLQTDNSVHICMVLHCEKIDNQLALPCHAIPCPAMSGHVMPAPNPWLLTLPMSGHVMPKPCRPMSGHVMSCHAMSCQVPSCHALSCPTHALSCPCLLCQ